MSHWIAIKTCNLALGTQNNRSCFIRIIYHKFMRIIHGHRTKLFLLKCLFFLVLRYTLLWLLGNSEISSCFQDWLVFSWQPIHTGLCPRDTIYWSNLLFPKIFSKFKRKLSDPYQSYRILKQLKSSPYTLSFLKPKVFMNIVVHNFS